MSNYTHKLSRRSILFYSYKRLIIYRLAAPRLTTRLKINPLLIGCFLSPKKAKLTTKPMRESIAAKTKSHKDMVTNSMTQVSRILLAYRTSSTVNFSGCALLKYVAAVKMMVQTIKFMVIIKTLNLLILFLTVIKIPPKIKTPNLYIGRKGVSMYSY